jgi:hypothetical protein
MPLSERAMIHGLEIMVNQYGLNDYMLCVLLVCKEPKWAPFFLHLFILSCTELYRVLRVFRFRRKSRSH